MSEYWVSQSVEWELGVYLIRESNRDSKKLRANLSKNMVSVINTFLITAHITAHSAPWYKCYKWPRHWILPDILPDIGTMPASHWSPGPHPGLWLADGEVVTLPRPICVIFWVYFVITNIEHYPGRCQSLRGLPTPIGAPHPPSGPHLSGENKKAKIFI